ncbi:MAG: ABC transporter substrate-binding protein [Lachnospiraceae bacterium]|nr:ABC transporter substrate-binding protein [Lachnospiraceae bacterium]
MSGKLMKGLKRLLFALLALFVVTVTGCAKEQKEALSKSTTKERVIALSKSNAELWVLAGGTLLATSDDAFEIEGLDADVKNLGDMDHVSLEAIAALDPDYLIVFSTDPAQKALGEAAQEIGIEVRYTNIDGYRDYEEVMTEFTTYTGREDLYELYVNQVKEQINQVKERVPKEADEKTYLLLHVSATKSKAEKNDYFASEIFNDLGLSNIAADGSVFEELSMEAILTADPAYIFVVPRGDEKKAMESFESIFAADPAWESLSAVKEGHYMLLPKDLFGLKPNHRWGNAYEEAYQLIYP